MMDKVLLPGMFSSDKGVSVCDATGLNGSDAARATINMHPETVGRLDKFCKLAV